MICANPKCRFHIPMPSTVDRNARELNILNELKPSVASGATFPRMVPIDKTNIMRYPYYRGGIYTANPAFHLCGSCHGAIEMLEKINRDVATA